MPHSTRSQTALKKDPLKVIRGTIGKKNTRSNAKKKKIISDAMDGAVRKANPDASDAELKKLIKLAQIKAMRDIDKREKQGRPPKKAGSKKIVHVDRIDFTDAFRRKFWNDNAGINCVKCNLPIAAADQSIDHKKPWSNVRVGLPTQIVCKDEVHWEVVYHKAMLDAYQDTGNLQPMHKACNSSKGGQKGNDSITPQKRGFCVSLGCCANTKAT